MELIDCIFFAKQASTKLQTGLIKSGSPSAIVRIVLEVKKDGCQLTDVNSLRFPN